MEKENSYLQDRDKEGQNEAKRLKNENAALTEKLQELQQAMVRGKQFR